MPSVPELEAAIQHDPDDLDLRRVYADALQEAGDPRGEHIALAFSAQGGDAEAARKVRAIERTTTARLRHRLDADYAVRLTWHLGFVTHVKVDHRTGADKFPRGKLRQLLEQRELLAVRGLDLRGIWSSEWSPERQLGLLPALVEGRPIRWLGFGDGEILAEHITALRKALPALTGLAVLTTKPRSAITALADLRDVELASRKLKSTKLVQLIFETLSPDLERLVLHGMDDRITADAFKPIVQREQFPKLRHFGVLGEHGLTWDLLRSLVGSPLLPQLESLGFSGYQMHTDDESETWFKENARAFAHVKLFTSEPWPDHEEGGAESSNLGHLLKKSDRPADAVPELEHHLLFTGNQEDHYDCWQELGEAMVWAGWPDEALEPLDIGVRLFKNKVDYDSIDTFRVKIEALVALGRWEAARELCVRALAHDEDHSKTHRMHGCTLRALGRHDEALEAFSNAVRHAAYEDDENQLQGWAYFEQGQTLWEIRRYDGAIATLAKARLRGDRTAKQQGWWCEARIARQRGDRQRAVECLERAVELVGPTDLKSPFYELGEVLFELGRFDDALAVWKRGASTFVEWVDVEEQGHALLALGRTAEALAIVETSRKSSGVARALILHALGRVEEALAAVDDLAHRPGVRERARKRGKAEPVCAARYAAGAVLEGVFHRAAGREADATERFEKLLRPTRDPRELHAMLLADLGDIPGCDPDLCGRPAAVAAILANLALGDATEARYRADALAIAIDAGSARLQTSRLWDVRGAATLLKANGQLAVHAAEAVERGISTPLR